MIPLEVSTTALSIINIIYPQGITNNLCPEGCGGRCHPQRHHFWNFQLLLTNWLSQNFDWLCSGKWWVWEVAFQSLSTIKNGSSPLHFQSNEPFLKFLRQLLQYEVPWSKTNQITKQKYTLWQHRSLLRQRYCAAYDCTLFYWCDSE